MENITESHNLGLLAEVYSLFDWFMGRFSVLYDIIFPCVGIDAYNAA